MSNKDLIKEVQDLSDDYFQKQVDIIIDKACKEMKEVAFKGEREVKCTTGNKKASEIIVNYFENRKIKCRVNYSPKEDYGDCNLYTITICW